MERTLQTIEKRASEFGGKPTLADVRNILTEVCQTFNHTVHSTIRTTPAMALAVSRSGSKTRPAVGRKLDPLPLEDRETFLLDLLRIVRTPQVRRSCIIFNNLIYRHPELSDLHKEKVSVKVSPDRWRHFVHAYHPQKKEYLKVPLDYNATFAFTEAEVNEAVKAANLRGKKLSNRTVVDIIKEGATKAPTTKKGHRDKAQKDLATEPLKQEEQKERNEPRKKVSFPGSVKTLETGLTDE